MTTTKKNKKEKIQEEIEIKWKDLNWDNQKEDENKVKCNKNKKSLENEIEKEDLIVDDESEFDKFIKEVEWQDWDYLVSNDKKSFIDLVTSDIMFEILYDDNSSNKMNISVIDIISWKKKKFKINKKKNIEKQIKKSVKYAVKQMEKWKGITFSIKNRK